MITRLITEFKTSAYPVGSFDYYTDNLRCHIRVPPVLPPEVRAASVPKTQIAQQYNNRRYDYYAACPAIESLYIAEHLRGQGLSKKLHDELLALDGIFAICATSVHNDSLREYFKQHPQWHELQLPGLSESKPIPEFERYRNFYRLTDSLTHSV